METLKTAKLAKYVVKVYAVECPVCGGDVANNEGSIEFFNNQSHGQTGDCTVCGLTVKLPAVLRDGVRQ